MEFSLVIPLYNEEKNIKHVVLDLYESVKAGTPAEFEIVLVENGSSDTTGEKCREISELYPNVRILTLQPNRGYGGGVLAGLLFAKGKRLLWLPGDGQVNGGDVLKVMKKAQEQNSFQWLVKGKRAYREDSFIIQLISQTYSRLVNFILGIDVTDINGLPKCFPVEIRSNFRDTMEESFTFDAEILKIATLKNFRIIEIPVKFLSRREGVSSWSGNRIKVYIESLKRLFWLRKYYSVNKIWKLF